MNNDELLAMLNDKIAATPAPTALPIVSLAAGLGGDDILQASNALTGTVSVPGMLRPFMPHQAAAFLYTQASIARWGGCLIGDDMGMGKTQVALAAIAAATDHGGYALVIAPPVTIGGWRGDMAAAFPSLNLYQAKGRTPGAIPAGTDIVFISDDPLTLRAWLTNGIDPQTKKFTLSDLATGAAMMVRDELHRDKGSDGKPGTPTSRSRLVLTLADALRLSGAPVIGMTGTLLTNRVIEALVPLQIVGGMPLIKALAPGARNAFGFAYTYTIPQHNGFGTSYNQSDLSKLGQLHEYLRRTVYVRREKSDLGNVLPNSGWLIRPIALNGVLARYNRVEQDFLNLILEEEGPESMWRKARAEALTRMQSLWAEAGAAKGAAAAEYIIDLVEQGRSVVAFYYHKTCLDALVDKLSRAKIRLGLINGNVTGDARDAEIASFQASKTPVILCQIRAAGLGVTLTAAADAVFVQVPWSAGDLKQAADRILRVDDKTLARAVNGEAITWHVLQAAKDDGKPTFDMAMWQVLIGKAEVCDAVNAGKPVTLDDESVAYAALTAWYNAAH